MRNAVLSASAAGRAVVCVKGALVGDVYVTVRAVADMVERRGRLDGGGDVGEGEGIWRG